VVRMNRVSRCTTGITESINPAAHPGPRRRSAHRKRSDSRRGPWPVGSRELNRPGGTQPPRVLCTVASQHASRLRCGDARRRGRGWGVIRQRASAIERGAHSRQRDGAVEKTVAQPDGAAGDGPAAVAVRHAKRQFFRAAERSTAADRRRPLAVVRRRLGIAGHGRPATRRGSPLNPYWRIADPRTPSSIAFSVSP
jgi:hypothetical protein